MSGGRLFAASRAHEKEGSGEDQFSDTSVVGTSTLLRHADSIQMTLKATGLPAGTVTTVWWVIFNNPTACSHGEDLVAATGFPGTKCGFFDLFEPGVNASVLYAAGHVVGQNGVGNYAARLATGPATSQVLIGDANSPLDNPLGADVHLVVHPHLTNDFATIGEELHHFGCGDCADYAFAAHETGS